MTTLTRETMPAWLTARGYTGIGVEIGVQWGFYSAQLLAEWPTCRMLISVDPWRSQPDCHDGICNLSPAEHEERYVAAVARLAPFGVRSAIWRMDSVDAAALTADGTVDFVYIDGRHDRPCIDDDLAAWWPKVRSGGILAGHDYVMEGPIEVKDAVDEFAADHGVAVEQTAGYASFWIEKP